MYYSCWTGNLHRLLKKRKTVCKISGPRIIIIIIIHIRIRRSSIVHKNRSAWSLVVCQLSVRYREHRRTIVSRNRESERASEREGGRERERERRNKRWGNDRKTSTAAKSRIEYGWMERECGWSRRRTRAPRQAQSARSSSERTKPVRVQRFSR